LSDSANIGLAPSSQRWDIKNGNAKATPLHNSSHPMHRLPTTPTVSFPNALVNGHMNAFSPP
jgi:hypothetical protein